MTNEEKILDILASMSLRMDSMATKEDVAKINIRIETEVLPKMDALAEGHAAILEQLVPVTRVDELESRVKFLESMLRTLSDELQQMKKAQ